MRVGFSPKDSVFTVCIDPSFAAVLATKTTNNVITLTIFVFLFYLKICSTIASLKVLIILNLRSIDHLVYP